jgi:hypothetical protein
MRPRSGWSLLPLALVLLLPLSQCASLARELAEGNPGLPWPAVDELGRSLPLVNDVGLPESKKFVGMFYFLWHHHATPRRPGEQGPLDISKILAQDADALEKPNSPLWGPIGASHYWGEPLYGYYRSDDPWVLRRHATLLADAGIDVVIFDATNAHSYPEAWHALCEVWRAIRQAGGATPKIAFMLNTDAGKSATELYHDLYQPGLYPELWFSWQDKPLLLCDPEAATPEVRRFFTLRAAHWPFNLTNTPAAWHWEATYPQPYGYLDNPSGPEQVSVSVAQNLRRADGKVTNMSSGDARGRSFHNGRQDATPAAVNFGFNFQEQWQRAFELQPPFVLVTGWNEWIAGRWGQPGGPLVFVDQMDEEFSRDIEPMKGGHGDNYYYQLVANIRRFKGVPPLPTPSPPQTINLNQSFDQWHNVSPEFADDTGETAPRDFAGVAALHYLNTSGRNDIVAAKVARDSTNICFYVRTAAPLTPSTGTNWMWLLIDSDQKHSTGWQGFDYIVNRTVEPDGTSWLECNEGGWNWKKIQPVKYVVKGNQLHLAIPRAALGLESPGQSLHLDFKWADNLQHPGDIMDFYLSGDVAPEGRFKYRYATSNQSPKPPLPAR